MPVSDILGDNPHNKPNLGETGHKRPKSKAPTGIAWADYTLNPWIGCEKVSPACAHCYAETWDLRFNKGENWGRGGSRQLRVDRALGELRKIAAVGKHDGVIPRVFIASLSDVFEDRADLVEPRKKLWEGLHKIDGVIPMLLTKRPEVMAQWAAEHGWPAHAWAGVTVENQAMADRRVPELLRVPASVRFLSMEPLLEWVRLKVEWLDPWAFYPAGFAHTAARHDFPIPPSIGWVIAGGESGAHVEGIDRTTLDGPDAVNDKRDLEKVIAAIKATRVIDPDSLDVNNDEAENLALLVDEIELRRGWGAYKDDQKIV